MNRKARVIALYLPQFHPIPENDKWWGKGFTEWTNVGKAKPLFRGHYQPKVPADLGYYDLRMPEVREAQAAMAHEAGIEGFMYWHYWFGNGKRLLERPFDEVLESGKPDFPFCLGWANHSWSAKNWNSADSKKDKLLIEQRYFGISDYRAHYETVLNAFKDPRYLRENNKPIFMIYDTTQIPDEFIDSWNEWARQDGFDGIYFIGNVSSQTDIDETLKRGFSALTINRIKNIFNARSFSKLAFIKRKIGSKLFNIPDHCVNYSKASKFFIDDKIDIREDIIPYLIPNFDHSPRSGKYGFILKNATPKNFESHLQDVLKITKEKENKIVILRSWNEWGEGNYVEPDSEFGSGFLDVLTNNLIH